MTNSITPLLPGGLGEELVPPEFRAQVGEQSSDSQAGGSPAEGGEHRRKKICFEHLLDCSQSIHIKENFALNFHLPRVFLQGVASCLLCDAQDLKININNLLSFYSGKCYHWSAVKGF